MSDLLGEIVLDAPYRGLIVLDHNIGRARVPVVRQAHAPRIRDGKVRSLPPCDLANEGTMNMPIDDHWRAEMAKQRLEMSIARFWRWSSPWIVRTGVDEGNLIIEMDAWQTEQPIEPTSTE